jgi:hypothetical protein
MAQLLLFATATLNTTAGACDATTFHVGHGTQVGKYASYQAATAVECCGLCAKDVKCGHFVWVPKSNGNEHDGCHLKVGSIAAAGLNVNPGYVAGEPMRIPPPPPPPSPPSPPVPPAPLGYFPHIVFFLADDLGHYNMGWRGNTEARTPALDALVKDGLVIDRHYAYQFCSPTRSAFLSGRLPIRINTKNMGPTALGGVDLRATTIADKLKSAGYATHQVGKWNAGSLCYGQVPTERGFDSSFGYMSGEEDHYSQVGGYGGSARGYMPAELLQSAFTEGDPALTGVGLTGSKLVDLLEDGVPALGKNGTYGAFQYTARSVAIVMAHDPKTPLFIYHAWQEAHTPNEVPDEFLAPEGDIDFPLRRTYEAMVHTLDSGVGNITAALRQKGMFDRALIILSADNGGRADNDFGGNKCAPARLRLSSALDSPCGFSSSQLPAAWHEVQRLRRFVAPRCSRRHPSRK